MSNRTKTKPRTSRISALLPASLTKELKRVSEKENLTQSFIIQQSLKLWLRERLKKDARELSKIDFDDLPNEDDWLAIQS